MQWSAVWDSEKKDFLGIITMRDLLEMIVFFVESLKESFLRAEVARMSETPFIGYFLERYLMIPLSSMTNDQQIKGRIKSIRQTESTSSVE